MATTAAISAAVSSSAHAGLFAPKHGGSPTADRIYDLWVIVAVLAAIIFVIVFGALLYAIFKFRATPGGVAKQFHGNTKFEIGATLAAAAIVTVIGVITFIKLPSIMDPEESDANGWTAPTVTNVDAKFLPKSKRSLNIEINAQQYAWRFVYPDATPSRQDNLYSYEELVVPTGTTVTLDVKSSDVGHAWWIPELGGKVDALPGYTNHMWFKVPRGKEGVYRGQCAELCGRNHGNMTARVRAVTPEQFDRYLAELKSSLKAADRGVARFRDTQATYDKQSQLHESGVSTNPDQTISVKGTAAH